MPVVLDALTGLHSWFSLESLFWSFPTKLLAELKKKLSRSWRTLQEVFLHDNRWKIVRGGVLVMYLISSNTY